MIQTVKLAKLVHSPLNVRQSGDLSIEQLAADIDARGILQNLIATPVAKPRGTFAVFAGGRRLRALHLLADQGRIDPETFDVPIQVLKADDKDLRETSLAEGFHQLKMTPAEECRAFQHFLAEDGDIDAVAKRFGITRRFVEGRLRLANLAEPIFEALANGEMTLDMAKAYASTEDRERQLHVYETQGRYGYNNADAIRRLIASDTMRATDPVARLVGADAYVAAGGRIDRDLFTEGGDKWIDPHVAQRVAVELMEVRARELGEELGIGWIRPVASSRTYGATAGLYRVELPREPLKPEEQERLAKIDDRLSAIEMEMEDEDIEEALYDALSEEVTALQEEQKALISRPCILPEELKAHVGRFLTLSDRGEMVLDPAYYSEEPLSFEDGEPGDENRGWGAGSVPVGGGAMPSAPKAPKPEATAPGGKALSARLFDELAMQRRDVLAASIIGEPALALDYAIFALADQRGYGEDMGTTLRAGRSQDPVSGAKPASSALDFLAAAHDALDAGWKDHKEIVDRFDAFRALDDDARAAWLAWCVASSLEARPSGYETRQMPLHNRLAQIIEVDPASWWRPTCENFFDRVSKASLLSLLGEVGGSALADRYASAKKGEISKSCETLFAGEAIVEPEIKERALQWVPHAMRFDNDGQADPDHGEADEAEGDEVPTADEADDLASTIDPAVNDAIDVEAELADA